MGADPNIPDKKMLYGKFQDQEDFDNDLANQKRKQAWEYQRKLIHKSTDIPISPDGEDMNVDARKSYSGLDWKHLAVLAAAGLGGLGIFKFAPNQSPQAIPSTSPIRQDYTTQIEIRDAITKKPIKIDWLNGDQSQAPQRNDIRGPSTENSPPPLFVAPK